MPINTWLLIWRRTGIVSLVILLGLQDTPCSIGDEKDSDSIRFEHTRAADRKTTQIREVSSTDGKCVLRVQPDKTIRLFDTKSTMALGPAITLEKGNGFRVTALAIGPEGKSIATGISNRGNDWGRVDIWDGLTGKHMAAYEGPPYLGAIQSITFDGKGRTLVIRSGPPGGK